MKKLIDDFISKSIVYNIDILNLKNHELDNIFSKFLFMINKNDKGITNIKFDKLHSITDFPSKYQSGLNKDQNLSNIDFKELLLKQIFECNSLKSVVVLRFINETHRFEFKVDEINEIYTNDGKKINKKDKLKLETYENDKKRLILLLNKILKIE